MKEVARRIERAACADSPVLIQGDKGVGKKLVAQAIHLRSQRSDGPLIVVSTEDGEVESIELELFGTGVTPGSLARASGGTLLIDEITEVPPVTQAKLLDAVEGRLVNKPDDPAGQPLDFRFMATTRHSVLRSIEQGALREDLFYRLSVVTISVPSLQDRKEDFPELVEQILGEICAAHDKPVPSVEPKLMDYLVERSWPGNAAELKQWLTRMVRGEETGRLETIGGDNPASFSKDDGTETLTASRIDTLAEIERAAVKRALQAHDGNRTQAAKALGISVRTLQRKLKHWGV